MKNLKFLLVLTLCLSFQMLLKAQGDQNVNCEPRVEWLEEYEGFCSTLPGGLGGGPASVKVHITGDNGCSDLRYDLVGLGGYYSNATGAFLVNSPGGYSAQIYQKIDGVYQLAHSKTFHISGNDIVAPYVKCKNTTVNLVNSLALFINFEDYIDDDSRDNCAIVSLEASRNSFSCDDIGTQNVTLTATDANGNSSSCNSVVTVVDNTAPTPDIDGLPIIYEECYASVSAPTATDNCDGTITGTTNDPTEYSDPGNHTITWTFIDSKGNSSSQMQYVNIEDETAPVAVCPDDITVNSDANDCSAVVNFIGDATDNCDSYVQAVEHIGDGTTVPEGKNRLFIVQMSHFGDGADSVKFNGEHMTLAAHQPNYVNGAIEAWYIALGTGEAIESATVQSFGAGGKKNFATFSNVDQNNPIGDVDKAKLRSWVRLRTRVKDLMYEGFFRKERYEVNGLSGQTEIFEGTLNSGNAWSWAGIKAGTGEVEELDLNAWSGAHIGFVIQAKHATTFSYSVDPESNFLIGTTPVTLTVTDKGNNTSTCIFNVIVEDNTTPTASCKNVTLSLDAGGSASLTPAQVDNSSSDNCNYSLAIDQATFDCNDLGTNTITLTVTDSHANSSTCTSRVTIEDNTSPVALCQTEVQVQLEADGTAQITTSDLNNGSSDVCSSNLNYALSTSDFSCAEIGSSIDVVMTVTDESGNTSSCSTAVTIQDTTAPTAICQDKTVQLDASGSASLTAAEVDNGSSDVCGIGSVSLSKTSFDCSDIGILTETLSVTDVNGNVATCTTSITVEDPIAPTAVCQDITLVLDAGGSASLTPAEVDNGSSDACGIASRSLDITFFGCDNVEEGATVVLTVTDTNNNSSTCSATVTVIDYTPATAQCQDVTIQLDAGGSATLSPAQVDNGSADACGLAGWSLSKTAFDCTEVGEHTVRLFLVDVNENASSCTATVTVMDSEAPSISCTDISIYLDQTGTASIAVGDINAGASDNCGIASLSQSQATFDCTEVGDNTVTLTATDSNGNTNTCEAIVTVIDEMPPSVFCKDATIQLGASGTVGDFADAIFDGLIDNCLNGYTLAVEPAVLTCANLGANTITLTATIDILGAAQPQITNCTATLTIVDQINPQANCQDITIELDENGSASIEAADINNNSSDNCSISLALSQTDFDCENIGPNTIQLTATDQAGNTATCASIVTVEDNITPTLSCKSKTVYLNNQGQYHLQMNDVFAGGTDNCSNVNFKAMSIEEVDCSHVGTTLPISVTVNDDHGNTNSCMASITVEDNTPPTPVCVDQTITFNGESQLTVSIDQLYDAASAFDNCDIINLIAPLQDQVIACSQVGTTIPVTISVKDSNGNEAHCISNITVSGMPCGWISTAEVGCSNAYNTAEYDANYEAFTLTSDCSPQSPYVYDAMQFVKYELCGDGMIKARVDNIDGNGFAGVQMRETTDVYAKKIAIGTNTIDKVRRELRANPYAPAYPMDLNIAGQYWVKIVRTGNTFQALASSDDINYTAYMTYPITMNNCIEVGMYVYSANNGDLVTAEFSNVTVSQGASAIMDVPQTEIPQQTAEAETLQAAPEFQVFPNPATTNITIDLNDFIDQEITLLLYNSLGQEVYRQPEQLIAEPYEQLNLSPFEPGHYMVVIKSGKSIFSQKLIITRM